MQPFSLLLLAPLCLALGCTRELPNPSKDDAAGEVELVLLEADEALPTVVRAGWTSPVEGRAVVQYGLDGSFEQSAPETSEQETTALGLKAGETYQFRVLLTQADGETLESEPRSLELAPPPPELPGIEISDLDDAQSIGGGFFLTSILLPTDGWIVIIDRDGDYVWYRQADPGLSVPTTHISLDHQSILAGQTDYLQREDLGNVIRVGLRSGEVGLTRTTLAHHDFQELPDGNLAWIGFETRENVEIEKKFYTVTGDAIFEAPEGTLEGEPFTERFNFFDDYVADPWPTCQHFWAEAYGSGGLDWTHANSLIYVPEQDGFYLMSKNLDALLWIDRQAGVPQWQINGLYSDFEPESPEAAWSHGHMSQIWDGGFMVFDNGYHYDPPHSRIMEVAFDPVAQTWSLVWEYWDPEERFITMLGDARKLQNGNYLGAWTNAGMITEITPGGEVVWRATLDLGATVGRITWFQDIYSLE